mmetsp:Transcript_60997/g.137608  ORF Transcript_60997/g.137608 Transcript_60997/m.137608 type:complete len:289 (+) Transcript_60997:709-1575(+)
MGRTEILPAYGAESLHQPHTFLKVNLTVHGKATINQAALLFGELEIAQTWQELLYFTLVQRPTAIKVALLVGTLEVPILDLFVPAHDLQKLIKVDLPTAIHVNIIHELLLLFYGDRVAQPSKHAPEFHNVHSSRAIAVIEVEGPTNLLKFGLCEAFVGAHLGEEHVEFIQRELRRIGQANCRRPIVDNLFRSSDVAQGLHDEDCALYIHCSPIITVLSEHQPGFSYLQLSILPHDLQVVLKVDTFGAGPNESSRDSLHHVPRLVRGFLAIRGEHKSLPLESCLEFQEA